MRSAFGQPVEERQDEGDHSEDEDPAVEHEAQEQQEHADGGEGRRERRPGHVDAGGRPRLDPLLAAAGRRRAPDPADHPQQEEHDEDRHERPG